MTAKANNQLNALGVRVDGSRQKFTVSARLTGPFTQFNNGRQHQALWFGPDQNNFVKVEVEDNAGTPGFVAFTEQVNRRGGLPNKIVGGPISPSALANAAYVDVFFTCDPATGTISFAYRVESNDVADIVSFGSPFVPIDVMRWFSRQAQAGVLVANQASTIPIVGGFETFGVNRAS
jgi:hypothetical protein